MFSQRRAKDSASERTPEHLYRYQSLDGEGLLHAERILLHDELHFCSPSKVNDPFDCVVDLDFEAPEDHWRGFLTDLSNRKQPHFTKAEHDNWVEDIVSSERHKSGEIQALIIAELQMAVNSVGLLCLSERNNCILMWSHYTNAHSGICLEFASDDSEPFIGRAQRVNYLPFYKRSHAIHNNRMEQVERILLSKAKCWAYEAEWRIIDHRTGYGLKYFDPRILTGVILGHSISKKDESLILNWISDRELPLDVYRAQKSPDGFQILICKYSVR